MKLFEFFKKNKLSNLEWEQLKKYPEKISIVNFNKKWKGKEIWHCDIFTKWILFSYNIITFCCEGRPIKSLKPYNEEPISLSKYMQKLDEVLEDMQKDNNPCIGCRNLVKKIFPKYKLSEQIELFTIAHYTKCHINCAYCFLEHKNTDMQYNAEEAIQYFRYRDMVIPHAHVAWGGGEPTVSKYFEDNIKNISSFGYNQFINTTGIIFSENIMNGLENGNIEVRISVDSGTPETFKKIKGVDKFDIVWNNIKKYCKFPDRVQVKYILFEWNANENDIIGFVKKCKWAGVKNVILAPEMNAEHSFPKPPTKWNMNDKKVTDMAALLEYFMYKNNIILNQTDGLVFTKQHNIDIKKEFDRLSSNNIGENYEF